MTVLVDKLEKELARNCRLNNWDLGFQAAIDIVKQHSDWQNLSSDTQLQDGQTDAVIERQTLIERIQPILDDLMMECFKHGFHQKEMTEAEFIDYSRKNCVPPKREIIGILKQHSDWISVSEEIPVLEYECGFRSFEPTNFYQIIDNEGGLHNAYFSTNRYANDDRALFTLCELSLYNGKLVVDDEYEVITVDMVKFWKPLQLPNWAQEKIYEQEMDKINFCGCGCILPDYLTKCSDCEVQL